jgi:2-oxo-3-hexenedioate decarboxylase
VLALAHAARLKQGYTPVGRKIGFTNPRMWDEYGVRAPVWGYVYDRTLHSLATPLPLAPYAAPRIEPEIVLGLSAAPAPGMDEAALHDCVGWVAHGFEVVQSIFPDWRFTAADTVAANGLHGGLLIGPRHSVDADKERWRRALAAFEITLHRNGIEVDRGHASNVLGGPLTALRHLVELLARDPDSPPLAAGEFVSTGTLTRAWPVKPGETWTTQLSGIAADGLALRFC